MLQLQAESLRLSHLRLRMSAPQNQCTQRNLHFWCMLVASYSLFDLLNQITQIANVTVGLLTQNHSCCGLPDLDLLSGHHWSNDTVNTHSTNSKVWSHHIKTLLPFYFKCFRISSHFRDVIHVSEKTESNFD